MTITQSLRLLAVASLTAVGVQATDLTTTPLSDSYTLQRAGKEVAPGTFRVQVRQSFGRADAILPDGRWVYFDVGGRSLEKLPPQDYALVVAFNDEGRVEKLKLVNEGAFLASLPGEEKPGTIVAKR